ncbi:TIGR03915 family putative DNA repair protein [Pseudomonas sp. PDM16]|uniref:TIGR03915 family putative DNA repair protein n=1 Tax=Pseudomonas sp. PDM16 TaxID=2769292 RepID=UPI00177B1B19|nr:TIGR03915 family putative DNA repair protein [Pseudomonas sp. PDM16]MBD9413847.1 TIGR03915 family putative DNA repair protein [Pseudomonas sp. PDM16]
MLVAHFNGSFAGWRSEARRLLLAGAEPHEVSWQAGETGADLLTELATEPPRISAAAPPRIPRELPELLETAARFRADDRWALLYRILWRVAHGDRTAMLAGDRDGNVLQRRIKSVHREAHHMHAFLRFRERTPEDGTPNFVAWHEPAHDILDMAAGHFAERLGRASWLIATPDAAALWDGAKMQILRPCPAELSQLARGAEDPGAELWLAYYGSTFNPARLNQDVLESNMPVRFWKDLPEGPLIPQLMSQARAGQQRLAQTASVGELTGKEVLIASDRAQPQRSSSTLLDNCRACTLWRDATCAVPGEGPNGARIMLIGDQPGDQEDLAGRPFIGTVGQVLQRALDHAKLSRDTLYLTHAVKHFKWQPGSGPLDRSSDRLGVAATQGEMEACRRWLVQELEQLAPRVIVALGKTALASLLKTYELPYMNMDDLLGRPFRHEELWVVVAPHPAAALNEDGGNQRFNELITALCQASQLAA